jgi:hypothetical protein
MREPIEYENQWGDPEKIYTDGLPRGAKVTFSTKSRTQVYCIPYDKLPTLVEYLQELIDNLTNLKEHTDD